MNRLPERFEKEVLELEKIAWHGNIDSFVYGYIDSFVYGYSDSFVYGYRTFNEIMPEGFPVRFYNLKETISDYEIAARGLEAISEMDDGIFNINENIRNGYSFLDSVFKEINEIYGEIA